MAKKIIPVDFIKKAVVNNSDDVAKAIARNSDDVSKLTIKNSKEIVGEGTKAVRRTANDSYERAFRKLELEETFGNATRIGNNKNHIFVDSDSYIIEKYANELKKNPNNQRAALKNATKGALDIDAIEEKTLWKHGQDKLIESNRTHSQNLRNKIEAREIKEEIARNYSDSNLANQIADNIENRGGYVGKEAIPKSNNNLKGSTPNTTPAPSHKELKRARYDSADSYMKYKQSQQYEEVLSAFDKKDFQNPLLKELNINRNTTMDEVQGLRTAAINSANKKDMGFTDMMGYHKVPQIATGVAGTAWLVNKMAASNGQQTNSQLYGQTPY